MAITNLSTADLRRELDRRERAADKLQAKRDKLAKEIAGIEADLAALGAKTGRRGKRGTPSRGTSAGPRRRAKNEMTLPDTIAAAMEVRAVVSPKEAAELVKKNGFKTTSKNFGMMVANALAKDARFKRVGRGQYERVR